MDITRFFEPIQNFVTGLIDKFILFSITVLITWSVVPASAFEKLYQQALTSYSKLSGITFFADQDNLLAIIIVLILFLSTLELNSRIMHLMSLVAPVQFKTVTVFEGRSIFYIYVDLLRKSYPSSLSTYELEQLFTLSAINLEIENQPSSRSGEPLDLIPGWILFILILYVFLPREYVSISLSNLILIVLILISIGLIWALYQSDEHVAVRYKSAYRAVLNLLAARNYTFSELDEKESRELSEEKSRHDAEPEKVWRIPAISCPWFKFGKDAWTYLFSIVRAHALRLKRRRH